MTDTRIRTSGTEVFLGQMLNMNSQNIVWNYTRMTNVPEVPGKWRLPEADSVGIKAPTMVLTGLYDASVSHATNQAGSMIDFQFLNELVTASGVKYLRDDHFKPPSGSEMIVEITSLGINQSAQNSSEPNTRPITQKYTLNLVVVSGTPWWTGTGIVF